MTGLAGRRWPAEWEPHAATAFTWPHNPDTWHQGLDGPRRALGEAIHALADGEHIHLHCHDADTARRTEDRLGLRDDQLTVHTLPSDDAWCRDHGAIVVRESDGRRVALDFGYNAWGGKYPPWSNDAAMAARMARYLTLPHERIDVVLEGGAIEGNGQGLVMTTASCVLNPNRNADMGRARFEAVLADALGYADVIWLEGGLAGDDTDGHIDNLARFVHPTCAVVASTTGPDDVSAALRTQAHDLGVRLDVHMLPSPEAFIREHQLPASYANFYIANRVVLVPVFGDPADRAALELLESLFTGRTIVPIDARDLVVGLGTLHCLTQQIPA
ncbi:MAG: agmatine deiminase family protein [Pseudomonadota bacterium]